LGCGPNKKHPVLRLDDSDFHSWTGFDSSVERIHQRRETLDSGQLFNDKIDFIFKVIGIAVGQIQSQKLSVVEITVRYY